MARGEDVLECVLKAAQANGIVICSFMYAHIHMLYTSTIYVCTYSHVCMYVCMYVCVYIYIYIYMYIYIYIHVPVTYTMI